ncbi:HAD family hydrolase [Massilia sp. Root351]|jgi:RNA polymerase II subunit A small phosphatase-like protein|uniref:HAD family hydrolase n=1 Tax=Massilia sp. Root351 TaxID=1736522 RepID=UPI0009EB557C|nr:HAD family hydrolase [Massilia sp. Root351]
MTSNLLIFDLDETLVHATPKKLSRDADFEYAPYFVYKRPFLFELLSAAKPLYDFAVWSSSSREYVDAVVAEIFAGFDVKFSWAVERCIQRVDTQSNGYVYIKDLRRVQSHGYPVERITILDDSPEKIARQPRNHLRIKPYHGLEGDRELLAIAEELVVRSKR